MRFYLTPIFIYIFATSMAFSCEIFPSDKARLEFDQCIYRKVDNLEAEIERLKREQEEMQELLRQLGGSIKDLPTEYRNENGNVSKEPGRDIGSASFLLNPRQTRGSNMLAIEQDVLETLCADALGCEMSLIKRSEGVFANSPDEVVVSGPCSFTYNEETEEWSRKDTCGPEGTANGQDDDQKADMIIIAGESCAFADSEPTKSANPGTDILMPDRNQGFFLIAAPSLQTNSTRKFSCELKIE